MTGLLPKQSDTAPVRGEEKNCSMEKIEPIRPKKKQATYIIRLAAFILNTKTANLFQTYYSIMSFKSNAIKCKTTAIKNSFVSKTKRPSKHLPCIVI